ncbi:glycosyltransferase [Microbacterium amylolyticum]|uniref:Dolichol-phosphate mannosyltransferase n=1 Tax=Microbacterium amylolyticum TaxID=936337 RepID=A0ABS4ZGJ8_9MICO|nr:glycosyltransferase family 2 protein [Microbacterium amylolyticum]MBP2436407.1 dolichol-phosphate mannosyltransferase [Microbacterium amylolyticum]
MQSQGAVDLTIVVPTFNERDNVEELVRRTAAALAGRRAEILFVDDSSDDTADVVERVAMTAPLPVRVIRRERATAGLGGAVVEGFRAASADICVVMDGDLQHPPETIPAIVDHLERSDADIVAASRYMGGGSATGLADATRRLVSWASTAVTRAMFPLKLREITDPMTGFFGVDRTRINLETLRPRGFKILLEIIVRGPLRVEEIPFSFADRHAGESKASVKQGARFVHQLALLRFGKMSGFALIGAMGAVANVAIVWLLTGLGVGYLWAAVIAAEATIIANFLLAERFVFHDMREHARGFWRRFASSFAFNNIESAIRIPVMALMVERAGMSSPLATAITLAVAFLVRFTFHSLVVYAPRSDSSVRASSPAEKVSGA